MKKILSILLTLCLFVNVSFAFDPYADEEVEKKSYKKLYYGIVLTLLGGFLAYDGFSEEEVDVSKPSVDYTTVLHSEWVTTSDSSQTPLTYQIRSGYTDDSTAHGNETYRYYEVDGTKYRVVDNVLYNNGNVDLKDVTIEVRYKFDNGYIIGPNGERLKEGGYHVATTAEGKKAVIKELKKGENITWSDLWNYIASDKTDPPNKDQRKPYVADGEFKNDGTSGLNLGVNALNLMDVKVSLKKNKQYKPIYETRHKSDIEGVAGIMVGLTGIYFLVDHFVDMHKFNNYAKRHQLNLKVTTASNEYKLMLQKRI